MESQIKGESMSYFSNGFPPVCTVPPVIMYGPEETTVLEQRAVTLLCIAEGDPSPSTTWIKEGHSLHASERVQLSPNGSLVTLFLCHISNEPLEDNQDLHQLFHKV